MATALIRPLAWEPPCAVEAALEKQKEKKKDTLFDMTWQPVHAWPQPKKDEIICSPSVSLGVQCKVLPLKREKGHVRK